jgi:hypothetical protein
MAASLRFAIRTAIAFNSGRRWIPRRAALYVLAFRVLLVEQEHADHVSQARPEVTRGGVGSGCGGASRR